MKSQKNKKKSFSNLVQLYLTVFLLQLAVTTNAQISSNTPRTNLNKDQIYFGISQGPRSLLYYTYTITGASLKTDVEKTIGQITAIRLDTTDPDSDPDIFISKTVTYPTYDFESDQICARSGAEYCILDNSLFQVGDMINIGVRCMDQCTYDLKVIVPKVAQLNATVVSEATTQLFLDSRSLNILAYKIPQNTSDIPIIQNLQFTVISYQLQSQMSLAYSVSNNFNLIQQRDVDFIVDGGKAIKFTNQDFGWCTNCVIYLIVNVRAASNFIVKTALSAGTYELDEQVQVERLVKSQQLECLSYNMMKAVHDAIFEINQYQGEMDIVAYYRNLDTNAISSDVLVSSEMYQQRTIIVRSIDRQRLGPANGIIYLCVQAYSDSSLSILPFQYYALDRYDAVQDNLYTFVLDSKDSVYFRFTSVILQQSAVLNITVQSFSNLYNIPRIFYTICSSSNIDECSLSESQQQGDKTTSMVELVGQVDNNLKNRFVTINHSPSSCPVPSNCIYMISVFNNDLSNPLKTTFKIMTTLADPKPAVLFKTYFGVLDQGNNKFYQVMMSPTQIQTLTISYLVVNLTSFNGRADLYASNITKNPNPNNFTVKSRTISPWTSLIFDVRGADIMKNPVYFGVNANFRTTFQIKFDAIFDDITDPATDSFTDLTKILLQEGVSQDATLDSIGNRTKVFSYTPAQENRQNRDVIITVNVQSSPQNVNLNYDIFYGTQSWTYLSGVTTIPGSKLIYVDGQSMTIVFRESKTSTSKYLGQYIIQTQQSDPNQQFSFSVEVMSAGVQGSSSMIETNVDQSITAYTLDPTQIIYFRQYLIDTNGTYQFQVQMTKGTASVMFKTGVNQPVFNKDDSTTYFQSSVYDDSQQIHTIQTERATREASSAICKNSSYTLRGGNNNCTMWIGVQCNGVCFMRFNSSLLQARTRNVNIPTLIRNDTIYQGAVARNRSVYYFIPFVRNSTRPGSAIFLQKQNNDVFLTVRVILNGWLPYFNWSYPTNTSNDLIIRSNVSNPIEILEISNASLAKCLVNQSCIYIVGVIGNGPTNVSISNYQLTIFDQSSKLDQEKIITDVVTPPDTYKYYWFVFNTTLNWRQTVSMKINSENDIADLYVSINSCQRPTNLNASYSSELFSTQLIQFSSNDTFIKQFKLLPRVLVIIAVKTITPTVNFTLFNYGPNAYNQTFLNFSDLTLNKSMNMSLKPLIRQPTYNFQIFRYFNLAAKQLRFGIAVQEGNLAILANIQKYQLSDSNPYFQIPMNTTTSIIAPISLNKSQNTSIVFSDQNNSMYICQFCWYYITVVQNMTQNRNTFTNFSINVTEPSNIYNAVPLMSSDSEQNIIIQANSLIQRRIIFQYQSEFSITVNSNNNVSMSVIISDNPNGALAQTFFSLTTNQSAVYSVSSLDANFQVGFNYYLSIASNDSRLNASIIIKQFKQIILLKDKVTLLNSMDTPKDFVKFYYYLLPKSPVNYTSTININVLTPGFIPNIYLFRNDIINNSFSFSNMRYPTISNSTMKLENSFMNSDGKRTYSVTFNNTAMNTTLPIPYVTQQNQTVNVTTLQNTSTQVYNKTSKKNQTVWVMKNVTTQQQMIVNVTKFYNGTSFNQSYYTIAIYWSTYGLSDYQKAQYEITYTSTLPIILQRLSLKQESPSALQLLEAFKEIKLKNQFQQIQSIGAEPQLMNKENDDTILIE